MHTAPHSYLPAAGTGHANSSYRKASGMQAAARSGIHQMQLGSGVSIVIMVAVW